MPAAQSAQELAPAVLLKVPAKQGTQQLAEEAPGPHVENLPASQERHVLAEEAAEDALYVPAGHGKGSAKVSVGQKWPAGQASAEISNFIPPSAVAVSLQKAMPAKPPQ